MSQPALSQAIPWNHGRSIVNSLKASIPQEITFHWHQGIEGSQPRLINRSLGFKGPWSSMREIHQGMLETATVCHHR